MGRTDMYRSCANADLAKGGRAKSSTKMGRSGSWLQTDPEMRRKKRVAKYKVFTVEAKVKQTVRNSCRWIKAKYFEVRYAAGFIAVTLLVTIMGISVVSVEEGNDTFLSNRSMRNLMANVRFDNGSDIAEVPPHYSNIIIGPRRYASIENTIETGKVLVDVWVQGSNEHKHFELHIGTDRGLVALDNKDRWGVDIFNSVYKSANIPKGEALATIYP